MPEPDLMTTRGLWAYLQVLIEAGVPHLNDQIEIKTMARRYGWLRSRESLELLIPHTHPPESTCLTCTLLIRFAQLNFVTAPAKSALAALGKGAIDD